MPTGDGLLARVHPPLGILSLDQARAVAQGARLYGNGHLDLTARANLQVRGVSEASSAPLAGLLAQVGLGDRRADGGPQRLTLTQPLAGQDPAELIDVPALARAIEAAALDIPGLPAKTLVVVEGRRDVTAPEADCLVTAIDAAQVDVAIAAADEMHRVTDCAATEAPAVVAALLTAFARTGRRRMRDLSEDERTRLAEAPIASTRGQDRQPGCPARAPSPLCGGGWPDGLLLRQQGSGEESDGADRGSGLHVGHAPSGSGAPLSRPPSGVTLPRKGGREMRGGTFAPAAGLHESGRAHILALDAPFGRCTADALDRLVSAAEAVGADALRLSPTRGFVLLAPVGAPAAAALPDLASDFIVAPDDPRRSVDACTGAPGCASGSTPTLLDAERLAQTFQPLAAQGYTAHVSGCTKGCARPGPADLTLVGAQGRYGIVIGGAPGDEPAIHLPIEAVLERLGRAKTVGLSAAFTSDTARADDRRDGRPA
ncbi:MULTISPECIES: precorrin-3B synthase [unclassified Methylobacterium]|jgi:precorrin-3B synthase|uniref:precorrin-3B synthase n=1 Tax=unclassified Methylobacterium TaxID=2615210 RepID=UPI001FEDF47D|nr:precorrin-3B synthase [Methylobacterium sp. 2A]